MADMPHADLLRGELTGALEKDTQTLRTIFGLPENADKISLCFSLPNVPGALHQVLARFALNGLNLTKIESRPIPGKAFEYDFYLDFTGNLKESHTLELLCSLSEELPRFTFLGNYLETKEL